LLIYHPQDDYNLCEDFILVLAEDKISDFIWISNSATRKSIVL